jgi:hypothetical protein
VIARAVRMARDALLRRDGESVWMKTGPGLLTRALAAELTMGDPVVTLLPQIRAGRHVKMHVPMPYKTTGGYWDGGRGGPRDKLAPGTFLGSLARNTDRAASASAPGRPIGGRELVPGDSGPDHALARNDSKA